MSDNFTTNIPKFKKQLKGFLTDESGKITKEDVLKMGIFAVGFYGAFQMNANTADAAATHYSACAGHGSVTPADTHGNSTHSSIAAGHANVSVYQGVTGKPVTAVVNGHVNVADNGFNFASSAHANGNGHASHGSHGSHCNAMC